MKKGLKNCPDCCNGSSPTGWNDLEMGDRPVATIMIGRVSTSDAGTVVAAMVLERF